MSSETIKPTIYLHLGTAKTGTTAIQTFIGQNLKHFEKANYYYPETGRVNNCHHGIAFYWGDHQAFKKIFNIGENHLSIFRKELSAHKDMNILISSECLLLHTVDWDELMTSLPHDNVKVILYFRRQDHFLASRYREHVKGNIIIETPDEWIKTNFSPNEYIGILNRVQRYVEKSNIIIRVYERQQFLGGSIFSDFCDVLSLLMTEEFHVPQANFNPHLSRDALEFNRMLNTVFDNQSSPYLFSNVLTQFTLHEKKIGSNQSHDYDLFSPRVQNDILSACDDVNKTIAQEYLGRADGLFYDPVPCIDEPWEGYAGLSSEKAEEIVRFILEKTPDLAEKIHRAFIDTKDNGPYLREAKLLLLPVLRKVVKL